MRGASYPEAFTRMAAGRLLSRPIFAPRGRLLRFADDLAAIFQLMLSLPHRLFEGDLHRYCDVIGISRSEAALMIRGASAEQPLFGRADAYDDGTEYRLLEFNIGTDLGGMDLVEQSRALLGVGAFRDFAERHGLTYLDTAQIVADQLRALARPVATGDRPVVALLETTGGLASNPAYQSLRETMLRCGLDFRLGEVQQVEYRAGRLELHGTAIDVALRYHSAREILHSPYGPTVLEPIYQAHDAGGTILYTSLAHSLFNAKGTLALLSDERHRAAFTEDERQVIDRVVPWTRMLVRDQALIEQCQAQQATLIVKPSVGWSAQGAVVGSEVTAEEWHNVLTSRTGAGHVVQRIVVGVSEPVLDPATGRVDEWSANWGVFVTKAGYTGTYIRARRVPEGTIVTESIPGVEVAGVFTY